MDVFEVVHLKKRLDGDLPVARDDHTFSVHLPQRLAFEGLEHLGDRSDPRGERCGIEIAVDEHESAEHVAACPG
jgi:hypothetical protein